MPTPANDITLTIGGRSHSLWSGWSIESDLLMPADAFELEVFVRSDEQLPPVLKEGAACTLTLNGHRVLTGQVDEFEHDISRQGHFVRINGRDTAGPLVDCSCPLVSLRDVSLNQIIEKIIKPLGVSRYEIRAAKSGIRQRVQIEPGQTAWEALLAAATANGLWPWVEPDGRLIVGGPDYTAAPVAELVLRRDGANNNVTRLSVRRSIANRFSQITVLGQHGQYANDGLDGSQAHIQSQVQDQALTSRGIFRPKVVVNSAESADMASTVARKLLADSRLDGFEIRAVVTGHFTADGVPWTPGQRVRVKSEPHDLDGIYFLMSRTMRLTRGEGAVTELRLREDKTWVLDANPPKTHKGSKSKSAAGGKTADQEFEEKVKAARRKAGLDNE
ncbi:hypothetical protein R84981_001702 [Carnimonas sp. R-84981]|uniref:phage baseplate assembly protein n=1 Tax=Carnimonas bestiolae TaxID=3402172 RepID=UPI003EDC3709